MSILRLFTSCLGYDQETNSNQNANTQRRTDKKHNRSNSQKFPRLGRASKLTSSTDPAQAPAVQLSSFSLPPLVFTTEDNFSEVFSRYGELENINNNSSQKSADVERLPNLQSVTQLAQTYIREGKANSNSPPSTTNNANTQSSSFSLTPPEKVTQAPSLTQGISKETENSPSSSSSQEGNACMSGMPPELISIIANNLDEKDFSRFCSIDRKTYNELGPYEFTVTSDKTLSDVLTKQNRMHTLTFEGCIFPHNSIKGNSKNKGINSNLLKKLQQIISLTMTSVTICREDLEELLKHAINLNSLELDEKIGLALTKTKNWKLSPTQVNLKKVNSLKVKNFNGGALHELMKFIENLNYLSMKYCSDLGFAKLPYMYDSILKKMKFLSWLDLEGTEISRKDLKAVLKNTPKLKFLSLKKCEKLPAGAFKDMPPDVLQNLESLDLEAVNISDEDLAFILKNARKLKFLSLERCWKLTSSIFEDPGIQEKLRCLDSLNLKFTQIEDDQINAIKQGARKLKLYVE